MSESYSNKPIVILKTSFTVSFVLATGMGIIYSFNKGGTFSNFLYLTYLYFANNLLMPITIAAIVCYYLSRNKKQRKHYLSEMKIISILSIVSLLLLFLWNILDFLFHYHLNKDYSVDFLLNDLREDLKLGAILAFPVSLLLFFTYNFLDARK
jgi:hypothetical protein